MFPAFNSIKVQLSRFDTDNADTFIPAFNSIKVQLSLWFFEVRTDDYYTFNSIKVQLSPIGDKGKFLPIPLSIP